MKEETGWEPMDTAADIETICIVDEGKEILLAAVSRLSDKQRRLIHLRYYEEKTEYEIAAKLGINQSNVHRQLKTIHKALKKILEKVCAQAALFAVLISLKLDGLTYC